MKKFSLVLFLIIVATTGKPQIPNNSFENWSTVGGFLMPDQWDNLNPTTHSAGIYTCTKGTPGNPGSAYLKLTSKTVTGMGVVPGIAVCGILDQTTRLPVSGFPYNQRPQYFTGKWQYMVYGIKPGFMNLKLTRWDGASGTRIIVASINKILPGMVMSWGNFSLPFVYEDGQYPDTCMILLSASGSSATNNDYLWLDNLQLTGTVTAIEPDKPSAMNFAVYPNPVRDFLTLSFTSVAKESAALSLFDFQGRMVLEEKLNLQPGENRFTLDVNNFSPGIYLLKVVNGSDAKTVRIMVR